MVNSRNSGEFTLQNTKYLKKKEKQVKILCPYLCITLLWSSYFYASDQSGWKLLGATKEEQDAISRDKSNKMSHADTAIQTLQSVLGNEPSRLVVAYLDATKVLTSKKVLMSKSHTLDYNISGIMGSSKKNTTDIEVSFIKSHFTDVHSIHQGKIVYNHATDTFSSISYVTPFSFSNTVVGYRSQAQTKIDNLDKQKSLSTVRCLPDGTTITVLPPRGICVKKYVDSTHYVDSNDTHLIDAYTRWLSRTKSQQTH